MAVPAAAPKKPANQGGKAAAYVQPLNVNVSNVSGTNALPHQVSGSANSWTNHSNAKQPGGTRGSGKGTR
jgi:hypothetical protein